MLVLISSGGSYNCPNWEGAGSTGVCLPVLPRNFLICTLYSTTLPLSFRQVSNDLRNHLSSNKNRSIANYVHDSIFNRVL